MRSVIRELRRATTLLAVVLLAGCAFGTRHPTLIYPPAPEPGAVPSAAAAERPAPKSVRIVLTPFADARSDKKLVGTVRNGFGMRTADVVAINSVPDWVGQAMKVELQNAGYVVTADGAGEKAAGSGSAVVSGEILNVFCDMYMSYTGQVSLIVRVSTQGREVLNRHYSGEGSAGLVFGATEESFAQSLALALASALKHFASDLDKSLTAR